MSDHDRDRGAYSPSGEPPLAFDPRQPAGRGRGRPPTTLIISILILLILAVGVVLYYRSGVRRSGEPPMVGTPVSDFTAPAPASAQPAQEDTGLQIYSAEQAAPASAAPTFAPPPERPLPRSAAPAAPPAAAAPPPTATPSPPLSTTAPASAAPAAPAPTPPAPPKPAPTGTPAVPAAPAAGGASVVQIGAFSSTALADKGWNDVARLLPGQMAGKTKRVEPVSKGTETLYRAYIGGFGSRAEATTFCDALKGAGHSCLVK